MQISPAIFLLFSLYSICSEQLHQLTEANQADTITAQPTNKYGENITIKLNPCFGNQPLVPDSGRYVTDAGDTITISSLKFYISHMQLMPNVYHESPSHNPSTDSHLFDLSDSSTYSFSIVADFLKPGDKLAFLIGVDSIDNTSGANSGDLDPIKGMYWAWNSGYIMAKLEGNSRSCKTIHNEFGFHIGGYKAPWNAVRSVELPLPDATNTTTGKNTVITLKVNVAAWFSGKLDLSTNNEVLIPGKEACMMADRYKNMFSVISITQ